MDHAEERQGRLAHDGSRETALAFASFVFARTGCDGEIVEFRMDENSVACFCQRCGE